MACDGITRSATSEITVFLEGKLELIMLCNMRYYNYDHVLFVVADPPLVSYVPHYYERNNSLAAVYVTLDKTVNSAWNIYTMSLNS